LHSRKACSFSIDSFAMAAHPDEALVAFQKRAQEADRLIGLLSKRVDQLEQQVAHSHKAAAVPQMNGGASAADLAAAEGRWKSQFLEELHDLRTILDKEREERDQLRTDNSKLKHRVNILKRALHGIEGGGALADAADKE